MEVKESKETGWLNNMKMYNARETFQCWADNTTIHGVTGLFSEHRCRKAKNAIVFFTSIGGLIYAVFVQIDKW